MKVLRLAFMVLLSVSKIYSITTEEQSKLNQEFYSELEKTRPNLQLIIKLIRDGADFNSPNPNWNSQTPLYHAVDTKYSPELMVALLQAGADPNVLVHNILGEVYLGESVLDEVLGQLGYLRDRAKALTKIRYIFLYGGKTANQILHGKVNSDLIQIIGEVFTEPLLQAIVLGDIKKVEKLLAESHDKALRNSNGISVLAYAAGQGNEKIISLLLRYPAYQQDIQGIEEAIEIVASRLRGLKPGTPEFKKYKAIFEGLTREHKEILLKILAGAGRTNEEELAPIQNLPPELQHYIVQLTTPQAYAAVFPHGNMK